MGEGKTGQLGPVPLDNVLHHGVGVVLRMSRYVRVLQLLLLVTDEAVDVPGAQVGVGVQLVHDPVGHPLLVDLSVVDLLLQGIVCHKTVDVSLLLLTISRIKSIIIMNESIRFQ